MVVVPGRTPRARPATLRSGALPRGDVRICTPHLLEDEALPDVQQVSNMSRGLIDRGGLRRRRPRGHRAEEGVRVGRRCRSAGRDAAVDPGNVEHRLNFSNSSFAGWWMVMMIVLPVFFARSASRLTSAVVSSAASPLVGSSRNRMTRVRHEASSAMFDAGACAGRPRSTFLSGSPIWRFLTPSSPRSRRKSRRRVGRSLPPRSREATGTAPSTSPPRRP